MTNAHQPDSLADIRAILAQVAASQQRTQERLEASQQRHDAEMAELRASQQTSAERFSRIEAIQEETQTLQRENAAGIIELRQSIADLRQENAEANAELRQSIVDLRQENEASNERLRQRIEQNSALAAELQQSIAGLRQENARADAELRQSISSFRQENAEANGELRREIKTNIDDVSAMIFDGLAETKKITDSNARAIQAWEQRLNTERDETITVEVDTFNAIDGLRTDVQSLTHFVRDGFNMLGQAIVGLRQELSAQIQSLIDITRDNTGRITQLEDENPGSS